jgi:hypothetical protein
MKFVILTVMLCLLSISAATANAQSESASTFSPTVHHLVGYTKAEAFDYLARMPTGGGLWAQEGPGWSGFSYQPKRQSHRLEITVCDASPENVEVFLFWVQNGGMSFLGSDGVVYLDGLPPKQELQPPASELFMAVNRNSDFKVRTEVSLMWGRYLVVVRDKRSGLMGTLDYVVPKDKSSAEVHPI